MLEREEGLDHGRLALLPAAYVLVRGQIVAESNYVRVPLQEESGRDVDAAGRQRACDGSTVQISITRCADF